ncbi:hypothetical protein LguiB_006700 [Lonicera macranthoides]
MIDSVLMFLAISLSMKIVKEFIRKSSSILLRSLDLTILIAENARSMVAVETGRVRINLINLSISG